MAISIELLQMANFFFVYLIIFTIFNYQSTYFLEIWHFSSSST